MEENNFDKQRKSVNLPTNTIDMVDNYAKQTGKSFSHIVDLALKSYFKDLKENMKKEIEELHIKDANNTILFPVALYIKVKDIPFTQVYSEEKKGKLQLVTLTENGKRATKTKYVCITDKHPDYHLVKASQLELKIDNLEEQLMKYNSKLEALEGKVK